MCWVKRTVTLYKSEAPFTETKKLIAIHKAVETFERNYSSDAISSQVTRARLLGAHDENVGQELLSC